jgi:GDP-4-dehydro-6-deoxy-D-mannose reductase
MKALVTGAAGFVGRHLCAHLIAAGDDVIGVDAALDPTLDATLDAPVDITDRGAVHDAIDAVHPDVVYHLAARAHVGESWSDGDLLTRVNVGGTVNVLDACRHAGVARVVVVGSAEQYGVIAPDQPPVTEDAPMAPISPYGKSKVAAEAEALAAFRDHQLGVVCVRAFNHTGPGQSPTFFVPAFAARIVAAERGGHDTVAVGNLDPIRDFTDVRDVVRAYRLLALDGVPGEAYNVCSGEGVAVVDLATRLVEQATCALTLTVDPQLVRPVDVPRLVGDPGKLVAATGWRREFRLDETLADVLAVARAR